MLLQWLQVTSSRLTVDISSTSEELHMLFVNLPKGPVALVNGAGSEFGFAGASLLSQIQVSI
jgi:hypothetical protein